MTDEDAIYSRADPENLRRLHLVHASLDETILSNAGNAIMHLYKKEPLANGVVILGEGSAQRAYGIGKVSTPERSDFYLCLKLYRYHPYNPRNKNDELLEQIAGFNEASIAYGRSEKLGGNFLSHILYFFGVISWGEGNLLSPETTAYGVLLRYDLAEKGRQWTELQLATTAKGDASSTIQYRINF